MSDDFDFDDDEDIDLDDDFDGDDDELETSGSDVAPVDDDNADDDAPASGKASKPYDPNAPVPFFKNWIWWVSLIAAVPAGFLVVSMVLSAIEYAPAWNWMMVIVGAVTFICACAALVTPLLLALGFMLGGKDVKVVAAKSAPEEDLSESVGDFDDEDGGFEDDDDDMFDDEEEDDFDF